MATAEIKAVITAEDRASAVVNNFGSNVNKASAGIGVAVAAMGAAAVAFGVSSVRAFAESERAGKQLDAVLKSTGGSAGVTKDAAIELSQSLMKLTAIDDDAILSAENMLLTFTSVGKDAFPDATKAILDTATAMNGGLKPTAEEMTNITKQLGKALQDPDAGLGALKRVGVNVDELQQKFTDSMPIQEKQRLILQELSKEFGGSADATGTFGDKLAMLQVNFGNLQEKIGGIVATALNPLLDRLNTFVEQNPALTEKLTITALAVAGVTAAVWALNTALSALSTILATLFGKISIIIAAVVGFYFQLQFAANVVNSANNSLGGLAQQFANARQRALDFIGPLGGLTNFFMNIIGVANNAAYAIDRFINKIPILNAIMPDFVKIPQGRAVGGSVASNTPYIVGEQGPELFVPGTSGNIIPNNKLTTGGSSTNQTTININVGLMTGSAIERREAAMKMFEDLKDIAGMQGQTVAQMIGGM